MATVVLAGTLDTKGKEYAFVRDRLRERGVDVILVDAGILGDPQTEPDISREAVARAGGAVLADLVAAGDRGSAIAAMALGLGAVVRELSCGRKTRRHARPGRQRRLLAAGGSNARAAHRRAQAPRLHRRRRRHPALRRHGRPDADARRRRYRRHQPDLPAHPGQCRRRGCRHGGSPRGTPSSSTASAETDAGGNDVRRHHPLRHRRPRAVGGARLRSRRLPRHRRRRPRHGAAHPRRLPHRRARRHHHRAGRRAGGRRLLRRAGPPGGRGRNGHPAGRLPRRPRHGQLRRQPIQCLRSSSRSPSLPAQPDGDPDAHHARRVRRVGQTPGPEAEPSAGAGDALHPACAASPPSPPRARSSTIRRPTKR